MRLNEVIAPFQSTRAYNQKKEQLLGEGITHIEDAEVTEFINTVANLSCNDRDWETEQLPRSVSF